LSLPVRIVAALIIYAALMSVRPEVSNPALRVLMGAVAGLSIGYAMLLGLLHARRRGGGIR